MAFTTMLPMRPVMISQRLGIFNNVLAQFTFHDFYYISKVGLISNSSSQQVQTYRSFENFTNTL
jgi:hypothetical protein